MIGEHETQRRDSFRNGIIGVGAPASGRSGRHEESHVSSWQILLKKSKIERRSKSREGRSLVISAAESLCKTITKTMIAFA